MTVAMEGFSIREYTSRIRSTNMVKCWPFDEASEEVTRAILPPITIKKFSWWFDKLHLVQDDTDLDSETLQFMRLKMVGKGKSKAKAPKKRSIVELFAVAPQVERVNSSDDDDENGENFDDDDQDSNDGGDGEDRIPTPKYSSCRKVGVNCKSKMKFKKKGILKSLMKKEKVVMIKDLKKDKVKKKKKQGKKTAVDFSSPKKEKTSKAKLQTSAKEGTSSNSVAYRKDLFDAFSTHSKKPRWKRLAIERSNCKTSCLSKFHPCDQEADFNVRGILKNPNKTVAAENISGTLLQDATKLNHSDPHHVDKHVTFSAKDDVFELRRKECPAVDLQLRSDVFSDVNIGSSAKGKFGETEKCLRVNEEDITRCIKNKFPVLEVTEKQISGLHYVSDASNLILGQHDFSQGHLFRATVPSGPVPLQGESYNRSGLHDHMYTCSSEIPKIPSAPCIPKLMIPMFNHSSQRWLDLSGDSCLKHDSDCSMDFLKAYPRPPASYISVSRSNLYRKSLYCSQDTGNNHRDHAFPCHWIPHLSPKELMQTVCSLPDWNSRTSVYGQASITEDFVGLPLNSLGELISMETCGKDGYNHDKSMSTVVDPSISSVMHNSILHKHMSNQIDRRSCNETTLCKSQHKSDTMKDSVLPPRFGLIEQHGNGKRNTVMQGSDPRFSSMDSVMDQMEVLHIKCRPHDQAEHPGGDIIRQHGNPDPLSLGVPRSTMRLMGKEFTIDRKDMEASEKKEAWMDKEVITENCGGNSTNTRFVIHPILGTLRETVTDFPKYKSNQASTSNSQTVVSESHNKSRNQSDRTVSKDILTPEVYPRVSLASSASPSSYNYILQESSSAHMSSPDSSRCSLYESNLLDSSQNVRADGKVPEYKTTVYGTQFASNPAWSQNYFKQAPRSLDSKQKGVSIDHHHPCSTLNRSVCYPRSISGTHCGTDASIVSKPEPFHLSARSFPENTFTSASLAHHPSFRAHPEFSRERRDAPRIDNQLKLGFRVRVPAHGSRSKKRLPPASKGSKKLPKIPKTKCQIDSRNLLAEGEAGKNVEGDVQASSGLKGASVLVQKDHLGECTGNDPFKFAGSPRSGPVKLTAGARYILKPYQNNDQSTRADGKTAISTTAVGASMHDKTVLGSEKASEVCQQEARH